MLLFAAFAVSAISASAQILINGSFEAQTTGVVTVTSGTPDTTSITGWTLNSTAGSTQLNIGTGAGRAHTQPVVRHDAGLHLLGLARCRPGQLRRHGRRAGHRLRRRLRVDA